MSGNVSDSSGTGESADELLQSPHSRRAKVWEYYEPNLVEVDNVMKAVCKYCAMKLACKSGTNSLRNHIGESCPKDDESRNRFLATIKKKPSDVGFVFDPQRSHQLMIKYCIHAEVPFRKFEDPYFEDWMDSMQPTFKVIRCHTVCNDCYDAYEQMKDQLRIEFESLDSRVCLTSDMWTSVQELGYMCITAHYIDANFNLKKKVISFKKVKYPHTSAAIEETLCKCLTEWGIKRKLFTLTLDNAANNKPAADSFVQHQDHGKMFDGMDFHVRCCAHILNILVQDGTRYVHKTIEKIRELLRHIASLSSRIQSFNAIAINLDLPEKVGGINLDIPNRWNSTYLMIGEALEYKGALNNYASGNGEIAPDDMEWTNAEVVCAFLKAFEEATKLVSADRTPTAHLFLHMVLCIRHALRDPQWSTSGTMSNLVYAMGQKFDKYWKESKLNVAVVIATVLDPTKKSDFLEFFFEKYCENVDDIDTCLEGVKDMMRLYYEKYEEARRTTEHSVSRQVSTNVGSPVLGKRRLEEEFAQYKSRRRSYRQPKSELDMYLEENFEGSAESLDILIWWKTHAEKYPVLSTMARDFLAIPLSTVSSESAFSCSGRTLGDTRCSMMPETLEALVCAKDWLIKIPNSEVEQWS